MIFDLVIGGILTVLGLLMLVAGWFSRSGRLGRDGWYCDGVVEEVLPDGSIRVCFAFEGEQIADVYKPAYLAAQPRSGLRVIVVTQFKDPRAIRRVQFCTRRYRGDKFPHYCNGSSRDIRIQLWVIGGFLLLLGVCDLCVAIF